MPDIFHDFPIKATPHQVFKAISTPAGLDAWWTNRSSGKPARGEIYELWFGPRYDWRGSVSQFDPDRNFELTIISADQDWKNTRVGFQLEETDGETIASFHHTGWPEINDHYRISCFCWAMYLRLLKRYVETGEVVEYENRLDA